MRSVVVALALCVFSGPVLAQTTSPSSPSPPPAGPSRDTPPPPPPAGPTGGHGRGAFIKMQGHGAEIAVRCADGDSTKACADVVMQLLDRARSGDRSRDMDRDRDRDYRYRDREY